LVEGEEKKFDGEAEATTITEILETPQLSLQ
jgi:hypothetical protein